MPEQGRLRSHSFTSKKTETNICEKITLQLTHIKEWFLLIRERLENMNQRNSLDLELIQKRFNKITKNKRFKVLKEKLGQQQKLAKTTQLKEWILKVKISPQR